MLALNHRVGEGLSLTNAEWSAWRKWATFLIMRARGEERGRRGGRGAILVPPPTPRVAALVVDIDSGMFLAGLLVLVLLTLVFPSVVDRPELPGLMVGMDCYMCHAGFVDYDAPRVMFPSGVARPRMLCIMAGMHHKVSYALFMAVACARLFLLVTLHLALCFFPCRAASRPVWITSWCCACCVQQQVPWVSKCRKLRFFLRCCSSPTRSLHHCHDAEAVSHGPDCLVDHRDSPLALRHGDRCPCCGTCSCCCSARAVRTWNLDIVSRPWI